MDGKAIIDDDQDWHPWTTKGWMTVDEVKSSVSQNRKFFKKVMINAKAAAKMLEHAAHGVEKGRKRSGMPIEIAGLLIGKIRKETFVIMDSIALPVEGTEAQVVADDESALTFPFKALPFIEAQGYMFIGWYHSHPFDLQRNPHWFLSGIDCQSQTLFQQSYNGAWCALVIDPIRSMAKNTLECGSFYCYPPEYNPPANEGPDGLNNDLETIQDRWGNAYKRYYVMETDFFMSDIVKKSLRPVFDDWKNCFKPELKRDDTEEMYDIGRLRTLGGSLDPSSGKGSYGKSKLDAGLVDSMRLNSQVTKYECRCRGYAQMIKHLIFNVDLETRCPIAN